VFFIEQEEVITRLQVQDESTSEFYRKIFLVVPILSCLAYPVLAPSSFGTTTLVLCVSSLLASAYTLWAMPPPSKQTVFVAPSPLEQYLPTLNAVLAGLLALGPVATKGQGAVTEGYFILYFLPAGKFADATLRSSF
jgi:hypothetical protein